MNYTNTPEQNKSMNYKKNDNLLTYIWDTHFYIFYEELIFMNHLTCHN